MRRRGKGFFDIFLTVLLGIFIVGILCALGYLIYKFYDAYKINEDTNEYLNDKFDTYINDIANNQNVNEVNQNTEVNNTEVNEIQPTNVVRGIDTNALNYRGYKVEGKLEMPSVNLNYPVLEQMKNANELEVSIAIQYGVGLNKTGNTVIVGHNYKSGLFFGSNKKMQIGDVIYITDSETGKRIAYQIYNKYTTEESDTSYYNRNTDGKKEVTLVTCQTNNNYRLVIWAKEM